jgi:hypothetical protein
LRLEDLDYEFEKKKFRGVFGEFELKFLESPKILPRKFHEK